MATRSDGRRALGGDLVEFPAQMAPAISKCHRANIIENMNGTVRRVCRNVKRWTDASMALRWTGAGMIEAAKEQPKGSAVWLAAGIYRCCGPH